MEQALTGYIAAASFKIIFGFTNERVNLAGNAAKLSSEL